MKTNTFLPRLILAASAAALCVLTVVPARIHASPPQFSITDLGTLGGGSSEGYGINASGQVAGASLNTGNPYNQAGRWTGVTPAELGTLGGSTGQGNGINADGQVAGWSTLAGSFAQQAVLWTGAAPTALGTLGGSTSEGHGINASGQIAGWSGTLPPPQNSGQPHAVRWTGMTPIDLGTLPTTDGSGVVHYGIESFGYGINDAGQVAGSSSLFGGGVLHAVRWTGTTPAALGELSEYGSEAYGINASGQVVGYARTAGAEKHAVLWTGTTPTDLATLGGARSEGYGLNDAGDVVGMSLAANFGWHAFLFTGGTMYDLNTLTGIGDLHVGFDGNPINNFGQIAAWGVIGGAQHAVLLSPTAPVTSDTSMGVIRTRTGRFVAGVPYEALVPFTHDSGHGTTARLLGGTAGVNRTVAISFTGESSAGLASDVVDVTGTTFPGMGSDTFVLGLTYDEAAAALLPGGEAAMRLLWLDPALSQWVNAVDGNTGATAPFFAGDGAYDPALDFHLGYYGVDTATNEVWAVINHNSTFSAAPTPEPTSAVLLGLGALVLTTRRRRSES